jgi:hypothetical protein
LLTSSYYTLNQKHESLKEKYKQLATCHKCIKEDPVEFEGPPSKKQKVIHKDPEDEDKSSMDPIKRLPEPIAIETLKCLTGTELISAMEVSKSWCDFISVRSGLMNKIVFEPTFGDCELPMINEIFDENGNKRHYKHMTGAVGLRKKYYSVVHPISRYASTLETLDVKKARFYGESQDLCPLAWHIETPLKTFPKLRKLSYDCLDNSNFLENSFPSLTYLRFYNNNFNNCNCGNNHVNGHGIIDGKLVLSFQQLKVLVIDSDGRLYDDGEKEETFIQHNAKLESVYSNHYYQAFMKRYQLSLKKLELRFAFETDVTALLQDLKLLKSLTIEDFTQAEKYNGELKSVRNNSIEILKIRRTESWKSLKSHQKKLLRDHLLLALPSLKELVLYEKIITESLLKFIGKKL